MFFHRPFPQSTGAVNHGGKEREVYITTITGTDKLCSFAGFSDRSKFVQKCHLTAGGARTGQGGSGGEIPVKIFEKGVDFLEKVRYNLFLHKGHFMS